MVEKDEQAIADLQEAFEEVEDINERDLDDEDFEDDEDEDESEEYDDEDDDTDDDEEEYDDEDDDEEYEEDEDDDDDIEGITREQITNATDDLNAVVKETAAVANELKEALDDIKSSFSLGSLFK